MGHKKNDPHQKLESLRFAAAFNAPNILRAKVGLYVFPSDGKTPLIPRFNKIDTTLTPEEREVAIEEFEAKLDKPRK